MRKTCKKRLYKHFASCSMQKAARKNCLVAIFGHFQNAHAKWAVFKNFMRKMFVQTHSSCSMQKIEKTANIRKMRAF